MARNPAAQRQQQSTTDYPSRPIDWANGSDDPTVMRFIDHLFAELAETGLLKDKREKGLRNHLNVIVCNLLHTSRALLGHWVRFSRSQERYKYLPRYHPYGRSYRTTIAVVNALDSSGYIRLKNGFYDRTNRFGCQARMRPRPKLWRKATEFGLKPTVIADRSKAEPIILRDVKKQTIEYPDTAETRRMRNHIKTYNTHLSRYDITLDLEAPRAQDLYEARPVDLTRQSYHRVFNNGSFEQGGRFYGPWWQHIKRQLRPCIMINGRPTAALDYSAIYIHLLYSRVGVAYYDVFNPDDDPYILGKGLEVARPALKTILLIALSASGKGPAKRAMRNELQDDDLYKVGLDLDRLIDLFTEKHYRIAGYFYSGIGVHLQYTEACVSEAVIRETMTRAFPALNIHDGYATWPECLSDLEEIMNLAMEEKKMKSVPLIKREY